MHQRLDDHRRSGETGGLHDRDSTIPEDGAGGEGALADCRGDALVGAFNYVSDGKCPRMRRAEVGVDDDSSAVAEIQLVAHQADPLLAPKFEDDATDVERAGARRYFVPKLSTPSR